jgi:hypothetical protein
MMPQKIKTMPRKTLKNMGQETFPLSDLAIRKMLNIVFIVKRIRVNTI